MSARLEVRGLRVVRGGRTLLRDVTLQVEPGEVLGVFGPSGAGKSTLFGAIAGELPARGEVWLGGRALHEASLWKRARAGLGYLPQGPSVLFDLSVRDNLITFARLGGHRPDAERWAQRVGLGEHLGQLASSLSGGERRRLELARTLLASPSVLLCDEPFAGLNPAAIQGIARLLREAAAEGTSVLISDHHLAESLALSRRAALLVDGAIELLVEAGSFASDPRVQARYVGG